MTSLNPGSAQKGEVMKKKIWKWLTIVISAIGIIIAVDYIFKLISAPSDTSFYIGLFLLAGIVTIAIVIVVTMYGKYRDQLAEEAKKNGVEHEKFL